MFVINTRIGYSDIHGIGVFSEEFVPKGTVVWKYHHGFDVVFTDEQLAELPKPAQQEILFRAWRDKTEGFWIYPIGNDGFMNHSDEPNLVNKGAPWDSPSIAAKDIQPGEELTEDYLSFDASLEDEDAWVEILGD